MPSQIDRHRHLLPHGAGSDSSTDEQSDAPPAPVKRTRNGGPRSRFGCSTCRARRVKCDESRPTCTRCARAKLECPGYPKPSLTSKAGAKTGTLAALAPKPFYLGKFSISKPLVTVDFDGKDILYFDLFRYKVVRELADGYERQLSAVTMTESSQNDFVRSAILSIGALARAILDHQSTGIRAGQSSVALDPRNEHYKYSLKQHLRAVSGFRGLMGDGSVVVKPSSIFIMTLLLITYEMMQGNAEASDIILSCGMAVFQHNNSLFVGNEEPNEGLEDIEHILPRYAMMGLFSNRQTSGRAYLNQMKASPDFTFPNPLVDSIFKVGAAWGRFFTLIVTYLSRVSCDHTCTPFSMMAQQAEFLGAMRQWKSILQNCMSRSINDCERRALGLIQIHWDVMWICVKASLDHTAMEFDDFEAQFRTVLYRCIRYMQTREEPETPRMITFSEGILMPLLCIVKCCRDHELRMTAAAIAFEIPWRESSWDARVVLQGLLGAVAMEESARDCTGFISSFSRWHWQGGEVDEARNEMTATYVRHEPEEDGTPYVTTLTVELGRWPDICPAVGCRKDHMEVLLMRDFSYSEK
ncbi:hypothetical protein B0I35DRAFT_481907 [Stachybotrys elegans]|uniref:Zn(2)-C6 fungal-type domain-containing protein n=1 Tax=Stachybotrys elegans TaxID=80388 RepID=A0A8K0SNF7_9HYPO|nr:hypothetical protein B0I35DRAFT_481907 [Stachybotrys elegans]